MKSEFFCNELKKSGFGPFTGVPCSLLKHVINYILDSDDIEYYTVSSEGEAMGLAGGFSLTGKIPVVMMQNDGYGNAVNPISSLQLLYKLPCLLIITWRGEPEKPDAPQHRIMGETIRELLSIFKIPFKILEDDTDKFKENLDEANRYINKNSLPFAFIIKKGFFEEYAKKRKDHESKNGLSTRIDFLKELSKIIKPPDIIIGATGFTGREVMQKLSHKGKFYMVGSMGCAASIGLGIALENPNRKVYVLDGDGALLMKMGTLSTVGFYKPENLIHICFDNTQYESTGGQKTSSSVVKFSKIAKNSNYSTAYKTDSINDFKEILNKILKIKGPHFIHTLIKPGTFKDLERPSGTPIEMKENLREFINLKNFKKTDKK